MLVAATWPTLLLGQRATVQPAIYPWEVEPTVEVMQTMSQSGDCVPTSPAAAPQCSDLTDNLCDVLWSKERQGKLKVSDGAVMMGKSGKSDAAIERIEDLRALLASEPRLPADFKKKAAPLLAKLRKLLAEEKDSKKWYRDLSNWYTEWQRAIDDTADERTEKRHPEFKKIKYQDLKIEQKAIYKRDDLELKDQILDAKYKGHPNWQRVERVFTQAREDVMEEIKKLKIPEAQRDELLAQMTSVKVTLPYLDPDRIGAKSDCASTTINAFYSRRHNAFTVCAGYFNTFQSDSALYFTVAHELAHAIDPQGSAQREFARSSWLANALKPLIGARGPEIPCSQWEEIVEKAKAAAPPTQARSLDAMQPLYDCLKPKGDLAPFSADSLKSAADRTAKKAVSGYASENAFTQLAQATLTKDGESLENEFYMRPDRLLASDRGNIFVALKQRDAEIAEIFTQSLACAELPVGGEKVRYENAKREDRARIFDLAVREAKTVIGARLLDWYSYCGRNCSALVEDNLAVQADENFADWLANRAFSSFLARKKNLRERREASGLATVGLCEEPGPKKDAPDLAATEKEHSLAPHPDTRLRRLAIYDLQNAALVECQNREHAKGDKPCDL